MNKNFNPNIWGSYYWFFLRTICLIYPEYPNSIVKKKYYDFFMNFLPIFIPNDIISQNFVKLLNKVCSINWNCT